MRLVKEKILIVLAFVSCSLTIAFSGSFSARSEEGNCPPAYQLPVVRQVRTDLERYLNEEITAENNPVLVNGVRDKISGLASFDSSYYNNSFVVVDIQPFPGGGSTVSVLFLEKPDKMFDFWIYELTNGNYEMRGVWLDDSYDWDKHFSLYEDYLERSRKCAL